MTMNIRKKEQQRSVKRHKVIVRENDGSLHEMRLVHTLWYLLYVAHLPSSKHMLNLVWLRFRMYYASFLQLCDNVEANPIFKRWKTRDAVGKSPFNIKLILLGVFRYIGRAWTYDDICEANGISIDTNREFMDHFLEYGSTVLYF